MESRNGLEIIFEGKRLVDEKNVYIRKVFFNLYDFYRILLKSFFTEHNSVKINLIIYVEEDFNIIRIDFISINQSLKENLLSLLNPYLDKSFHENELKEIPIEFVSNLNLEKFADNEIVKKVS
jgi:hypothetical protein